MQKLKWPLIIQCLPLYLALDSETCQQFLWQVWDMNGTVFHLGLSSVIYFVAALRAVVTIWFCPASLLEPRVSFLRPPLIHLQKCKKQRIQDQHMMEGTLINQKQIFHSKFLPNRNVVSFISMLINLTNWFPDLDSLMIAILWTCDSHIDFMMIEIW